MPGQVPVPGCNIVLDGAPIDIEAMYSLLDVTVRDSLLLPDTALVRFQDPEGEDRQRQPLVDRREPGSQVRGDDAGRARYGVRRRDRGDRARVQRPGADRRVPRVRPRLATQPHAQERHLRGRHGGRRRAQDRRRRRAQAGHDRRRRAPQVRGPSSRAWRPTGSSAGASPACTTASSSFRAWNATSAQREAEGSRRDACVERRGPGRGSAAGVQAAPQRRRARSRPSRSATTIQDATGDQRQGGDAEARAQVRRGRFASQSARQARRRERRRRRPHRRGPAGSDDPRPDDARSVRELVRRGRGQDVRQPEGPRRRDRRSSPASTGSAASTCCPRPPIASPAASRRT